MVRLRIDGIEIRARQGETILKAARRAKVHIPTLCHLSKLSPIASCRLCLVEERGSAGYLLSCQTPVKEGMEIATKSRALEEHRLQLMQFYAMNHPLECGVCDKSGECELQNRVHELRVNEQPFAAREKARALETWKGGISYDESLCIVCERCVRVCNELIGDSCLRVLPGGFSSRIVFKESSHCSECGECVAVCPVGALSSRAFHYTSNAWELKKHSSSCPHCALACPLEYETKNQGALSQGESQIYRISHDREFGALCKMGRYAFRNRKVMKPDTHAFANALEAFKKADTIAFSSYITNEEALILQKLKEEHGYRLYNPEALAFQTFARMMRASFGGSDETKMKSVEMSDCIVALGGRFYDEAPLLKSAMSQAQTRQGAKLYWLHPLEESRIKAHGMWRYEVGAEEGVVALLLASILEGCAVDGSVEGFLEELDWGYVSSESNLSEEELSLLRTSLTQASSPILVIGADLYAHPRATNIARMLGILQKHSAIKILLTPPSTNTLGVALLCDLDEEKGEYTIGYNTQGDFILSSLPERAHLLMPALNQQEGTFTNIDKRVIPLHPALPYEGYELNDIAKALGLKEEHTIHYTPLLPKEKGFLEVAFDSLPNHYENDGSEKRGYYLSDASLCVLPKAPLGLEEVEEIGEFNGSVVYFPSVSPEAIGAIREREEKEVSLRGGRQFALAAKIQSGDRIEMISPLLTWRGIFEEDPLMKGVVAILDRSEKEEMDKSYGYAYQRVRISKLD